MKSLAELRSEQRSEVEHQRSVAERVVRNIIQPQAAIIGVLLTGSVARGDARRAPFGLYIDTSLEYLEKEFALAKIYPGFDSSNPRNCEFPDRGDMLVSIFELVSVFEEFDQFDKADRFAELETVVNNNVARFKHLELFSR